MLDKYNVFDFSSEYKFLENYNIRTGINNVFDAAYATRRASGYLGLEFYLEKEERFTSLLVQNFNSLKLLFHNFKLSFRFN
jgi:outer membrane receptor protein involved in Fe transport